MKTPKITFLIAAAILIGGCAAPGKRFEKLNEALALSPSTEQGREALENQCKDGASSACAFLGGAVEIQDPLAILQGQTSTTQTRFAVYDPDKKNLTYYLRATAGITKLNFERLDAGHGEAVDHVEAFQLDPKQTYELIVVGPNAELRDRRTFRSLQTDRQRARIALVSGADPELGSEAAKIWSEVAAQRPDALFLLGNHSKAGQQRKARSLFPVFKANPLIPVLAVWNDADYGKTDRTSDSKTKSLEEFEVFFPQNKPAADFEPGPGLSFWWKAFGVGFAFLDNRSFRSPDGIDLPDQTRFGADQEVWLKTHIMASKDPVILVSGDAFFGTKPELAAYESAQPKSFATQTKDWSQAKVPLVFITGNRGLSEIVEVPKEVLGYKTFEVSSNPLFAKTALNTPSNYVVVEIMRSERNLIRFHVQGFSAGAKLNFQKTLMVKR